MLRWYILEYVIPNCQAFPPNPLAHEALNTKTQNAIMLTRNSSKSNPTTTPLRGGVASGAVFEGGGWGYQAWTIQNKSLVGNVNAHQSGQHPGQCVPSVPVVPGVHHVCPTCVLSVSQVCVPNVRTKCAKRSKSPKCPNFPNCLPKSPKCVFSVSQMSQVCAKCGLPNPTAEHCWQRARAKPNRHGWRE